MCVFVCVCLCTRAVMHTLSYAATFKAELAMDGVSTNCCRIPQRPPGPLGLSGQWERIGSDIVCCGDVDVERSAYALFVVDNSQREELLHSLVDDEDLGCPVRTSAWTLLQRLPTSLTCLERLITPVVYEWSSPAAAPVSSAAVYTLQGVMTFLRPALFHDVWLSQLTPTEWMHEFVRWVSPCHTL